MPTGTRNMLAITWSMPSITKMKMGHQMAMILETTSRAMVPW